MLAAVERISRRTPLLGLALSGGVDSTVMLAAIRELGASECVPFTVGFEGSPRLDVDCASEVASRVGAEHHAKVVASDEVTPELLVDLLRHFDEPTDVSSRAIGQHFMTRDMKEAGVRAGLSGAHGEQILGGISWPRRLARLERKSPETAGMDLTYRMAHSRKSFFSAAEHRSLTGDDFDVDEISMAANAENAEVLPSLSPFENQTNGIVLRSGSGRNAVFTKVISPIHQVEIRSGFLDRKLFQFSQSIPPALRGSDTVGMDQRLLLNAAFKDLAPTILEKREKQAFSSTPWPVSFRQLEPLIVRQTERIGESGFLNPKDVKRVLRKYHERSISRDFTNVWLLCVLQTWLDIYIDDIDPLG